MTAENEREKLEADNYVLRWLLWLRHGCNGASLYGDDGEMQCNTCMIDFKRDDPLDIEQKWIEKVKHIPKGARWSEVFERMVKAEQDADS